MHACIHEVNAYWIRHRVLERKVGREGTKEGVHRRSRKLQECRQGGMHEKGTTERGNAGRQSTQTANNCDSNKCERQPKTHRNNVNLGLRSIVG
jgi:hypothetical protein